MQFVGARGVVHMPQFNGKQKFLLYQVHLFCTWPELRYQPALPPQRSSERNAGNVFPPCPTQPLECLEQASGKADKVVFASPDTGQQGVAAFIRRDFVTSMHCRGRR